MGDRTYTSIQLAGSINEENVDELLEAANADGLRCDDGPEGFGLQAEHLKYVLYDEEANYGNLKCIQEACKRLGVSYCKWWYAGCSYGPGIEIYSAVTNTEFSCNTINDEPSLSVEDLKRYQSQGKDIEEIIGYLESFSKFTEVYGELEIVPAELEVV